MIPKHSVMRVARPTDNLEALTQMYVDGLGFQVIGSFKDHGGFNGSILGHPNHSYHLEFTNHSGTIVGNAPTQDNLLVFYLPCRVEWTKNCDAIETAGFERVQSYNPYWESKGKTYKDLDGYRIVLQNEAWTD